MVPIVLTAVPSTESNGPAAAVIARMVKSAFCCSGFIFFSRSTSCLSFFTPSLRYGMITSPNVIPADSSSDFNNFSSPERLSRIVSAMSSAAPFELVIAIESFLKSSSDALRTAAQPLIAFCPNIALSAAACSDSVSSPRRSRTISITSIKLFMEPSVLVICMS